ncbi:MAG: tRNA lysidine(34) synthetase TilS [Gammaproteobacteria bacterium]|nr:tRNA lysidine(34) synthetase TilS [Gammaproteobacteria bacterium]
MPPPSRFAALSSRLDALPDAPLLLAYSGGADSEALLRLLLLRLGASSPRRLRLVHVHHGLSPNADAWEAHCAQRAESLGIPFLCRHVHLELTGGDSLEAQARAARYGAMAKAMQAGEILLTAHHRDDQAETVLLRLLRGSGTAGLAALRAWQDFGPGRLWRPLLGISGSLLRGWLAEQGLSWLEDESNAAARFDRNFLRHEILPRLSVRWSAAAASLARHAAQAAEDEALLGELARADLVPARQARPECLTMAPLLSLSPARERNALRLWLKELGWQMPSRAQMDVLSGEVLRAAEDAKACLRLAEGELRAWRGSLFAVPMLTELGQVAAQAWPWPEPIRLSSGLGWLKAQPAETGLRAPAPGEAVSLRYRAGGERCRPAGRDHSQSLKKLFQEHGVPPWLRERLPLVYFGEELVAVAGVFVCAQALALPGEPAWSLELFQPAGICSWIEACR